MENIIIDKLPYLHLPEVIKNVLLSFPENPPLPSEPIRPTPPKTLTTKYEGFSDGSSTFFGFLFLCLGLLPFLASSRNYEKFYGIQIVCLSIVFTIIFFKIKFRVDFKKKIPQKQKEYQKQCKVYENELKLYASQLEAYHIAVRNYPSMADSIKEGYNLKLYRRTKISEVYNKYEIIRENQREFQKKLPKLFQLLSDSEFLIASPYSLTDFFVFRRENPRYRILIEIKNPIFQLSNNKIQYPSYAGGNRNEIKLIFAQEHVVLYPERSLLIIRSVFDKVKDGLHPRLTTTEMDIPANTFVKLHQSFKEYLIQSSDYNYLVAIGRISQKKSPPNSYFDDDNLPF